MRGSVNADTEVQTRTGRVRKSFGGRQNSSWAAPKAMRGKCERGHESANADGAGTEVFAGDGCSQGRLSTPWLRFHGVDRPDVYIIIHVRVTCCGKCALNPPTSQPIPHRRPSLAPTQRHALPEHFCSPTQLRRTPAGCAMHSPPTSQPIPRTATRCLPFRSASGTKKRHRTVHVRCRMSRSTVVAVGHLGW